MERGRGMSSLLTTEERNGLYEILKRMIQNDLSRVAEMKQVAKILWWLFLFINIAAQFHFVDSFVECFCTLISLLALKDSLLYIYCHYKIKNSTKTEYQKKLYCALLKSAIPTEIPSQEELPRIVEDSIPTYLSQPIGMMSQYEKEQCLIGACYGEWIQRTLLLKLSS